MGKTPSLSLYIFMKIHKGYFKVLFKTLKMPSKVEKKYTIFFYFQFFLIFIYT